MSQCTQLAKCPFYNDRVEAAGKTTDFLRDFLKRMYCHSDSSFCARYLLVTAHLDVPDDILPHETNRLQNFA